jgi:predicted MPP superfamily phosphohydrolase
MKKKLRKKPKIELTRATAPMADFENLANNILPTLAPLRGKNQFKRILFMSDLHCGSVVGLTAPQYWQPDNDETDPHTRKLAKMQRENWYWYAHTVQALGPFDCVVANGDLIDGNGSRSGGTEQITTDRQVQATMAAAALLETGAKKFVLTYGTAYHTGDAEDFEQQILTELKARDPEISLLKIGAHDWLNINGTTFDVKHHLAGSAVPQGRNTALLKEKLWNILWHLDDNKQPLSDVIIRSHVHYYAASADKATLVMSLPALQGLGTKFGSRRCMGTVDYGLVIFDVQPDGSFLFKPYIANLVGQRATPIAI